jgi:hypothetical protein
MRKRGRPRAVSSPGLLVGNASGRRGEPGARKFLGYPHADYLQRRGWAEHHLRLGNAPLIAGLAHPLRGFKDLERRITSRVWPADHWAEEHGVLAEQPRYGGDVAGPDGPAEAVGENQSRAYWRSKHREDGDALLVPTGRRSSCWEKPPDAKNRCNPAHRFVIKLSDAHARSRSERTARSGAMVNEGLAHRERTRCRGSRLVEPRSARGLDSPA